MDWTEAHLQGDLEAMQQAREEAIVRAALERVALGIRAHTDTARMKMTNAKELGEYNSWSSIVTHLDVEYDRIRALASDPAEVAAIIKAAGEDRG